MWGPKGKKTRDELSFSLDFSSRFIFWKCNARYIFISILLHKQQTEVPYSDQAVAIPSTSASVLLKKLQVTQVSIVINKANRNPSFFVNSSKRTVHTPSGLVNEVVLDMI
jgi:hypothetical protein